MLSEQLLQEAQSIKRLENLLSWAIKNGLAIHTTLKQDEFSSDIVLATGDSWLVFDVS